MLYDIGDYHLCQLYIDVGLQRFPTWKVGVELNNKMQTIKESNENRSDLNDTTLSAISPSITITIDSTDWGKLLKGLIQQLKTQYQSMDKRHANDDNDTGDNDDGSISTSLINAPVLIEFEDTKELNSMEEDLSIASVDNNEDKDTKMSNIPPPNESQDMIVDSSEITSHQSAIITPSSPLEASSKNLNDSININTKEKDTDMSDPCPSTSNLHSSQIPLKADENNDLVKKQQDVQDNPISEKESMTAHDKESILSNPLKRKYDEREVNTDDANGEEDEEEDDTPEVKRTSLRYPFVFSFLFRNNNTNEHSFCFL